jgi:hypothetical protein
MYHFDNDRIHVYYDKIREQMEEIKNKRLYSPDFNWQIRAESGKNDLYIDGQKIETDFPEIVIPEIDLSGITIRKDTSKTNTDLE